MPDFLQQRLHSREQAENVNCDTNSTLQCGFLNVTGRDTRSPRAGRRIAKIVEHGSILDRQKIEAKKN